MYIKSKPLYEYSNGNTHVTILKDGTKIRECFEDIPNSAFPETIDVKITNNCNINCSFCHEMSTINGKHCDINLLSDVLAELPKGIELAIGGGNPLAHPELIKLLTILKEKGFICNITVNQDSLDQVEDIKTLTTILNKNLIYGLGISITNFNNLETIKSLSLLSKNIVYHVIVGIHNPLELHKLIGDNSNNSILLLGYKEFGRGVKHNIDIDKESYLWVRYIDDILKNFTLSFDNLAIEQLNLKAVLSEDVWRDFYMGDDFTHSMYIDAVEQQYAPTSRSKERVSFKDSTLIDYFINNKN